MIVNVIAAITILQVEKVLGLGKVKVVGAIEKTRQIKRMIEHLLFGSNYTNPQ